MDEQRLMLVPMPRCVEHLPGWLALPTAGEVAIDTQHVGALCGAAFRLRDAAAQAGVTLSVVVGEVGDPALVAVTLSIDPQRAEEAQGYVLEVEDGRVSIVGHDPAGAFYGVCTLIQLLRQFGGRMPCLRITDYPDLPARGVMLDVSRSKVPTLETLLSLTDRLAGLKINELQLYTEHTFAYREHREVWANASPITGQEILILDAYCRERHIDLVPNQNSFGHLRPWLEHPKYSHLAECPDGFEWLWGGRSDGPFSLNPTDPASLDLVRSMFDDLLPHFSSKLLNVGCDETHDLGQGRSKEVCEARGVHRVYLDFLLQIYELARERGRTMQFWGDIILHEPDLIPELPKDAIALEWGYERDHDFDGRCRAFAKAGVPFYVCPGTSSWNSLSGRTDNAIGNMRNAAENGLKHGAIGYLNTDWGDNGHWQYLPVSYLGYAYGAAVSWAYEANAEAEWTPALSLQVFEDGTGTMGQVAYDLGNVYTVYERLTGNRIHNTNYLVGVLYAPVEATRSRGIDWAEVAPELFSEGRAAIEAAMAHLPGARMTGADASLIRREYEQTARLLLHACDLGMFKIGLAGRASASAAQRASLAAQAASLAEDMRCILAEHQSLWMARNRIGGLEEGSAGHYRRMIEAYRRLAEELGG
ncbi:MAG: family 20 glycosylhydrolase [Anaerolineae bacterium]|nr:family 20 glycosylhydrolase [Anaerolineae bacterium]